MRRGEVRVGGWFVLEVFFDLGEYSFVVIKSRCWVLFFFEVGKVFFR